VIARLNPANAAAIQRLATQTGISVDLTVNWVLEKVLATKAPGKRRGRAPLLTDEDAEQIRQDHGRYTYAELADRWNVSIPTIRRACGSLKTTR